jgi:hypothetical protein
MSNFLLGHVCSTFGAVEIASYVSPSTGSIFGDL